MKNNSTSTRSRAPFYFSVTATCAAAVLAGCMGSPTYGTGKTANAQLMEDLTGVLSINPGNKREQEIAYKPRSELVRPASTQVLPAPQENLATAGNPAWPESPEQRRQRIRQEATESGRAHPELAGQSVGPARRGAYEDPEFAANQPMTRSNRAEVQQRIRQANQGDANQRRYLSEPPTQYRVPSATAATGDLGEDEWKKERAAASSRGKGSWRDYIPWL